jgi:glyoxylase-like metal-dependent hydrolase (beta-lactamase superfamily II)
MTGPSFYLKQLELGPMQNFVYLIGDRETKEAAVIDPGWEAGRILEELSQDGYRLTKVFVTHSHFDHVMALGELLQAAPVPVYAHRTEAANLGVDPEHLQPTSGGETIQVGDLPVTVLHTPGHTTGSQCYLVEGWLFSGDTLFIGACGRWDLPGGDPAQLHGSLTQTLRALDDGTILCPGHHYGQAPTARLGQEKQDNPFLRQQPLETFLRMIGAG